ncbi:HupE/UreJ family protein [Desertibaculum subflavum]|uniref:HupE/UreJ family protein n=1 Tax=Desertibaculum subflavum TaxID=2268458 RepID=UPI000E66393C
MRKCLLATLFVLASAGAAAAHTGHGATEGFAQGFAHPLLGLDHLLAMIAVGLWGARIGGRARWLVPAAFVGVMALGGVIGVAGFGLPLVELGIVGSVLVLGLLVAAAPQPPLWAPAAIVALFALFHGHAHGTEMPEAVSGLAYSLGFVLATALLHSLGLMLGLLVAGRSPLALRLGGGAIAACGALLLIA